MKPPEPLMHAKMIQETPKDQAKRPKDAHKTEAASE